VTDLQALFGQIDIYLFDQLLRGRVDPGARICDAGCGSGRNLVYFLRHGYDVRAVDADPSAIQAVRSMAATLAPHLPGDNFRVEPVEKMSFPDGGTDLVLSSAVLHFARDDDHFDAMLRECWRLLDRNGLFFCRLASSIGIEARVHAVGSGRFVLPDGSERYLVTETRLMELAAQLGGELIDPLKTTIVQNQRSMTTWVMRKTIAPADDRGAVNERLTG
jgi:SAM-dependent methyltransferase